MSPKRKPAWAVVDLTADEAGPSRVFPSPEVVDLTKESEASAPTVKKRKRKPKAVAAAAAMAPDEGTPPKRKRKIQAAEAAGAAAAAATEEAQASPPAKKDRARKEKAPKKEKRTNAAGKTVRWAEKPSIKCQERIQRALPGSGHRLFLISRKTVAPLGSEAGPVEEFAVLGATGNVYTVTVGKHPTCSCPDAAKGNLCKHSLFVMLRVIRLAHDDPLVWQRALLREEAEQVLSGARSRRTTDGDVHASDAVRRAYSQATGQGAAVEEAAAPDAGRPVEGDCPVCFDDLQDEGDGSTSDRTTVSCAQCGNHLHTACFKNWAAAKRREGLDVTCVYCRSVWPDTAAAAGGSAGGILNLAQHSTVHANAPSLHTLYGANAVWIEHHARGGNRRHAATLYNQLAGR